MIKLNLPLSYFYEGSRFCYISSPKLSKLRGIPKGRQYFALSLSDNRVEKNTETVIVGFVNDECYLLQKGDFHDKANKIYSS